MRQLDFAELRDQLQASLAHLAGVAEAGGHAAGRQARELANKLADERFVVVVAGEFKRGKSTLINALLGQEVLPTAVVPLTSIVTAVTWGSEPRAEVRFADGRVEQIDARDLARFVTERENPENRLGVDRVLVRHP